MCEDICYFNHFHTTEINLNYEIKVLFMDLLLLFTLTHIPVIFKKCVSNVITLWLFVNGQTMSIFFFFFFNLVDCLVWESTRLLKNAFVSWLRKISACVNVHASIYTLYIQPVVLSTALFILENTVGVDVFEFLHFKCRPTPPSPYILVHSRLRNFARFKWYIWKSDGWLANRIGLDKTNHCHG